MPKAKQQLQEMTQMELYKHICDLSTACNRHLSPEVCFYSKEQLVDYIKLNFPEHLKIDFQDHLSILFFEGMQPDFEY